MTAPTQFTFAAVGLHVPVERPLLPVEFLMIAFNLRYDDVVELVECGRFAWAWDIRTRGADRRELRVWKECFLGTEGVADWEPERVANDILRHGRAEVRSTELQTLLCASPGHIQNLIDEGSLEGLNQGRPGPNGFVRVTRASVERFFADRRIT